MSPTVSIAPAASSCSIAIGPPSKSSRPKPAAAGLPLPGFWSLPSRLSTACRPTCSRCASAIPKMSASPPTPFSPVLLGDMSVDSGEITVLGNRYAINRGEVRFLNPVKLEPTLDMDLETKSRGVTVNVSISGSPQKLNVNYSSDPPLQSREIIALLAVGRNPSTASTALAGSQISSGSTSLGLSGGALLVQGLS